MKTSCHNSTKSIWRLISPLLLLLIFAVPSEALAQTKTVLVVMNAEDNTGVDGKDEDFQYLSILEDDLGFEVISIDHNLVSPADAEGVDLIFISESVGSGNVANKFAGSSVPVVNAEVFTWDDMGWMQSNFRFDVDAGFGNASKINIANSDHPLLGGLRAGQIDVYADPPTGEESNQIGYAVPAASADIIATPPNVIAGPDGNPLSPLSGRATLFTFSPGDELADGSTANARAVAFFAHRRGSENLSDLGAALFKNAVLWAVGNDADLADISAPAPAILVVLNAGDNTGEGGADEDFQYLSILEDELGFDVVTIDHNLVAPGDTAGVDLIFISESVGSGNVAGKFKGVRIPVVNAEVFTWDDMGWMQSEFRFDVDAGFGNASSVQVASKTHPILGGAPTFELTVYDDPPAGEESNQIGYAVPTADAEILTTLPGAITGPDGNPLSPIDETRATQFVLNPGSLLEDGSMVWARRSSFFAHRRGSENLSEAGANLFANTILWAAGREAEVRPIEVETPSILVVFNADDNTGQGGNDEDFRYLELLEDSLGYNLVTVDQNLVTRDDTVGVVAIFISESVGSGNVADKFAGVPLPIVNAEVFTWDDMDWMPRQFAFDVDAGFGNSSSISIMDVDHPILTGLSPGDVTVYDDPPAGEESNQIGYAVPNPWARILATTADDITGPDGNPLPDVDGTRATLFVYERGDTLVSTDTSLVIAPARRASFFAHRRGSENLSEVGEKLFINTIAWVTGREVEVRPITSVSNERGTELPNSFAIESVYPNPFNPAATVELSIREAGPYEVNVYDVLGRVVQKHAFNASIGQQHVALDMTSKASGMYLIQVVQTMTGKAAVTRAVLVK